MHRFVLLGILPLLVSGVLFIVPAARAAEPVSSQREGNPFGINLGWEPGWGTVGTVRLLSQARTLVGDWGWLRHGTDPKDNLEATARSVAMIRAHRLRFVSGGAYPDRKFLEEGKAYPRLDPDGTMGSAARDRAAAWRKAYAAGIPFYAVEVLNEVNIGNGWPPEKYARYLYDYAVAVKAAYPGIKVCSCGMAGSGDQYYDKMLTAMPELKRVVDFWGLHPYGANNPPEKEPAETTLRSHELTARVLARHGVSPIRLMCTETGYELEIGDTGKNTQYPPIREDNRAEYMARAFRDYYLPDERIEMVAPFMLWDLPWHGWDGWQFMNHDGTTKPIYDAIAAMDKPAGSDWLPTGDGAIEGQLTWGRRNIGVPRVVVYTEPGYYGDVTDSAGRFRIRDLPPGDYTVKAFADGWTNLPPRRVRVGGGTVSVEASLDRASLVPAGFDPQSGTAHGWSPLSRDAGFTMKVDSRTTYRDRPTLRLTARRETSNGVYSYGAYNSAYPNEVQVAEVYVRSSNARADQGAGPWLELSLTNGRGELLSSARAYTANFTPDGRWYRITAAVLGPPRTSRVRLSIGIDQAAGDFWFSEPFVGEADFPLPSDDTYISTGYFAPLHDSNDKLFAQRPSPLPPAKGARTAVVTGEVRDFRGRPLPRATVASDDPLMVGLTDGAGRYEMELPSGRELRLRAFALGETPAVSEPIKLRGHQQAAIDLQTKPPNASRELVNGGFNKFTPDAPGLLSGWSSFGATDGTTGSRKMIFEVPSYEGDGLYFAQSGSNTKNGGAYQIVEAAPGGRYRLTGRIYTRTEGGGKRSLDNNGRIGIDPTGGRDPDSDDIVWSDRIESDQAWTLAEVTAEARTSRITVFVDHQMRRANVWNLVLFDDFRLAPVE